MQLQTKTFLLGGVRVKKSHLLMLSAVSCPGTKQEVRVNFPQGGGIPTTDSCVPTGGIPPTYCSIDN